VLGQNNSHHESPSPADWGKGERNTTNKGERGKRCLFSAENGERRSRGKSIISLGRLPKPCKKPAGGKYLFSQKKTKEREKKIQERRAPPLNWRLEAGGRKTEPRPR